jgi:hypothetical protein
MPVWFELLFVGGLGIAPILWMQWQKPFCIFSLLLFSLRPDHLSEDQRKLLGLFKSPVNQFLSVGVAVVMAGVLWRFYQVAPIANGLIFPMATRGTGLLVAAIAFFFANLFLQVPVSVGRVLLIGDRTFTATQPYPVEQVPTDFTLLGFRVNSILPTLIPKPSKPVIIRPVEPVKPKVTVVEETVVEEEPIVAVVEERVGEAIESMEERVESVDEAIESVEKRVESVDEAIESADQMLPIEIEPAPMEEQPALMEGDSTSAPSEHDQEGVEGVDVEVIALREEIEGAIAAVVEEPETILAEGVFEEAIAQQEPEVVGSEIIELEIIELDGVALVETDAFAGVDEIIEAVEIKVVEVEVKVGETVGEEERAIAPEPVGEDWGDDEDLDDL